MVQVQKYQQRFIDHTNNYADLYLITRGTGGYTTKLNIGSNGNVNVVSGDIQVGGTTVIDSAKNLLNLESIKLLDNKELKIGTASDFVIKHNATDSHILNNTGDLFISNFADDKDIVFRSDDGSGGVTEYFRIDGGNSTNYFLKQTNYADNIKALFGTGNDLQIHHDGSSNDSFIQNYTGTLYINNYSNDKDIFIQSDDGSGGLTTYLFADGSEGSLKLFHYGSKKLETTSTGIDVTGVITTDGLTTSADINFGDDDKALFGASNDLKIYHSANNQSYIHEVGSGDLNILATNLKLQDAGGSILGLVVNSTGIDITGTVTSDGLTVDGEAFIQHSTPNVKLIGYRWYKSTYNCS